MATQKNKKLYISDAEVSNAAPLNQAAFEALTWLEVGNVGTIGQMGIETNIVTYDTLATTVSSKGKGTSNAGDATVEALHLQSDVGQVAMSAAGRPDNDFEYAFKVERNDKLTGGGANSIRYNRGLVVGPIAPQGGVEDFEVSIWTMGLTQDYVDVDAT